jgi:hypothetical protein
VSRAIVLEPGDGLRLAVELSPTFTQKLRDMTQEGDQVVFYTLHRRQEGLEIVFVAGETTLPVTPRGLFDEYLLEEKGSIVQRALGEALPFSMEVTNRSNQSRELGGWQRARLPRRTMTLSLAQGEAAQPPVLPICEIRLYSASGRLKLAGF